VARTWGEISAYAARRGRPRPQNDTWIAACCLVYGLPLATLNAKDFEDFAEHEGLALVGRWLTRSTASDGDDLDQLVRTDEVGRVAGVEPGGVGMRGGGDQQI
jgi:hypothetical protein